MRLTRDEVRMTVRSFIDGLTGGVAFGEEDDLLGTGVLHSIEVVELIMFVGSELGVALAPDDVYEGRLASFREIVDLVSTRMAA